MSDSISIPGYRILRKLGQGGMASVYLAVQESFDREVALKVMSPFLNSDASFATRFLREAHIVAQIHHSSIVPVMDVGQSEGNHYLSMEYLPGGDLKQRIVEGRHGANLALNVCVAISSALDLAHRKGFVHRDIKPENILFREDGTPVLTDFGIARAIEAGTQLTMVGTMVGTPSYMSPEQVKGAELDGRSDLYSLGVVFYEMLTGLVPFRADSTMTLAMKHLTEPLPLLPPQFSIYQPFLDRLMAKEREDRFASGAEVIRALRLITDMAIAREQTIMRNRAAQQPGGPDMPTLVAPPPGATNTGPTHTGPAHTVPLNSPLSSPNAPLNAPTASQPGTIRIPSTSTQPSGVMQVPALAAQPSAGQVAPTVAQQQALPEAAMVQPTLVAPPPGSNTTASAGPSSVGTEELTAPRPTTHKPVPQPKAPPKPPKVKPAPRPPGVPLQVQARALLQKFASSKHSTLAVIGVAALLAIGTGYLLGRTTDADAPAAPLANQAPAPAPTRVAVATLPQSAPVADATAGAGGEVTATPESGSDLTPTPPEATPDGNLATDSTDDAKRIAQEEARKKKQEEEKQRRLEREKAQALLAQQQREKNAQAERERTERIKQLLQWAKFDIGQGHLVSPPDNNAADRYREVLSKQPGAAEAQEARDGMKRIAEILVAEVYRALANGDKDTAQQLVNSLQAVQADHPELSKLQARVADTNGGVGGRSLSRTQKINLEKTLERLDKVLKRDPQTLASIKDAVKEYDRAQGISSTASGMSIYRVRLEASLAAAVRYEMSKGNTKQARELVALARGREWLSPELQQLEQTLDATQSP